MKTCPNGHLVPNNAIFCPYDGYRFPAKLGISKGIYLPLIIFLGIIVVITVIVLATKSAPPIIHPIVINISPTSVQIIYTPTDVYNTPQALQQNPTPYPTIDISCPGAPPIRIEVGNLVRVTTTEGDKLRLRSSPEATDNIIRMIPTGTELRVIDGPMCSDAFSYWEIQIPGTTQTGWVAEGDYSLYYIEPVY
jgi:hypothetical protein